MNESLTAKEKWARRGTYVVEYALVVVVLLMIFMYHEGFVRRDLVVVEDSAYFAIFFVVAQLVPVGIRTWINWKVSWGTLLLLSSQFVYTSYLRVVYHHIVPEEMGWTILFLVSMTIALVAALYSFYRVVIELCKLVTRVADRMIGCMTNEQEVQLHRMG